MRFASLISSFALIVATLGSPAQQLCGLTAPAGQRQSAVQSSCCGTSECCPHNHCSCSINPQSGTDDKSVAAPSSVTDGSLFHAAPVAATNAPADAGLAARVVRSDPGAPTPCHAFCRSNRAPPQS
jgi:hypothetical protein